MTKKEREEKYKMHTAELIEFDNQYSTGIVAGIDEVGRGPLAGDVYAACVVMPKEPRLLRVDDSKKLSDIARCTICKQIKEIAIYYNIGIASVEEIEKYNILGATKLAMQRAAWGTKPDCFLVDAVSNLDLSSKTHSIISGDSKSYCIAAASILAKVYRDAYMAQMAIAYPQYNFAKNKGYGTKQHIDALIKYGPCPLHRKSFITKYL